MVEVSARPVDVPAARLSHVSHGYVSGGVVTPVIREFTMNVPSAAVTLLRGPSGCGKSTVLRLLAGIDVPFQGDVDVAGVQVSSLGTRARAAFRARYVGYLFQNPPENLLEELTCLQQVVLGARLRGVRLTSQAALAALEEVGVGELAGRHPSRISGGQQQRVAIAAVLAGNPGLLVADEPTAELDAANGEAVLNILAGLARAGRAVVLASHGTSALRITDYDVDMTTHRSTDDG